MDLGGVGLATDLALIAMRGQVIDRGAYVVARTPDDPGYYHGNLLVLAGPPRPGELAWTLELFAREVATLPAVRHVTLSWSARGEPSPGSPGGPGVAGVPDVHDELIAAGFGLEVTHVMVADALRPAPPPAAIELRPLAPDELARAAELRFVGGDRHDEAHRQFLHRRAAWQRDLVSRGVARFWGAFDDRTLVASLGVVRLGQLGRYQDVQTTPSHCRRGIAAALLSAAGGEAVAAGVTQLVIKTASASDAERVYARAGFRTVERIVSACRLPT
jgi:GNAT superfamily N-acetyltransferase